MAGSDPAWRGWAGIEVRSGMARFGQVGQGKPSSGEVWHALRFGLASQAAVRHGKVRHGGVRHGWARCGMAGFGRHCGEVWHGLARSGMARPGMPR